MEDSQTKTVQLMFLFVVDSILTGVVSLFGFVGNTLTFAALRCCQHLAHDIEPLASLALLLQGVTIANIGVLWSIFLMYVVPAFGFVIPLLHDCNRACQLIVSVVHPIYLASRAMVASLTVASLAYSGRIGSTTTAAEKSSPPRNAMQSSSARRFARWMIAVPTLIVCLWSALMIADSWIVLSRNGNNDFMKDDIIISKDIMISDVVTNDTMKIMTLEQSFWYRLVYVEMASVLTIVIPILVGCVILIVRYTRTRSCCGYIQGREFVKPLTGLFLFMTICYVAEIISNIIDIVDQLHHPIHNNGSSGSAWAIYSSAGSRLCVAIYSALGTLLLLLSNDELRGCLRDTCHGRTPVRQEFERRKKSRKIYRCDDATKVTLISQEDDVGFSNVRERTTFAESMYRSEACVDEETILTDGEVICNV